MRYQRIRDAREDLDLTQTHVANMLHVTQPCYSKYESGDNDILTTILIQLATFTIPPSTISSVKPPIQSDIKNDGPSSCM